MWMKVKLLKCLQQNVFVRAWGKIRFNSGFQVGKHKTLRITLQTRMEGTDHNGKTPRHDQKDQQEEAEASQEEATAKTQEIEIV